MDVLHTDIVVVDGRSFRVQSGSGSRSGARGGRGARPSPASADPETAPAAALPPPADVARASDGAWFATVSADATLARRALEPERVAEIARDLGASVLTPRDAAWTGPGDDGVRAKIGEILVRAPDARAASEARARVAALADAALRHPDLPYTHFVGVPLVLGACGAVVAPAARAFRDRALRRESYSHSTRDATTTTGDTAGSAPASPPSPAALRDPGRMHIELFPLKLCSDERRARAKRATRDAEVAALAIARELAGDEGAEGAEGDEQNSRVGRRRRFPAARIRGVRVERRGGVGVASMEVTDASSVRGWLHRALGAVARAFADAGLLEDVAAAEAAAKSATIALSRRGEDAGALARFRDDVDWGVAEVEEVHLSKRGDFDVGLGGYYRCEAKAALGFGGEVEEPARDPGER